MTRPDTRTVTVEGLAAALRSVSLGAGYPVWREIPDKGNPSVVSVKPDHKATAARIFAALPAAEPADAGLRTGPTTTAADMPCFNCGTPWRVISAYREGREAAAEPTNEPHKWQPIREGWLGCSICGDEPVAESHRGFRTADRLAAAYAQEGE